MVYFRHARAYALAKRNACERQPKRVTTSLPFAHFSFNFIIFWATLI